LAPHPLRSCDHDRHDRSDRPRGPAARGVHLRLHRHAAADARRTPQRGANGPAVVGPFRRSAAAVGGGHRAPVPTPSAGRRPMKKIVVTGGPGSGKTVITARIAADFPERFVLVPEAATQVYTMLQTRWDRLDLEGRYDAQRWMYRLQLDQEA